MTVKLYVEGGGDHNKALQSACRRGFAKFLERAGLTNRMPRIVACGGRRQAYDHFKTAHDRPAPDEFVILLVDSEARVTAARPWEHVEHREGDGWERPDGASDDQLHFMVQMMEAWFHADPDALKRYFGAGFRPAALSKCANIEEISKADLLDGLKRATQGCEKNEYSKGRHSFPILETLDPHKVRTASPRHAGRFLDVMDRVCRRG